MSKRLQKHEPIRLLETANVNPLIPLTCHFAMIRYNYFERQDCTSHFEFNENIFFENAITSVTHITFFR
jgi:hypothetical protein